MRILLDNGHGVDTLGKRSPLYGGIQLFEWQYNRDIVKRILRKCGELPIFAIVPEDEDVRLMERVRRANALIEGDTLLVSIHANAGGGTGFEAWAFDDISAEYAHKWAIEAKKCFPNIVVRSDGLSGQFVKRGDFTILTKPECPSILTENLFMDNRKDFEMMMTDNFREGLAEFYIKFFKTL